ncbi:MAG TPA: ThiF family adenylyltransferase [Thermoanaerobaculia bacterium]
MTDTAPDHWYSREPDRLRWELDQFEQHELPAKVLHDDEGHLVVVTEVHFRGEPLAISASYPHAYPHFAPTIGADRYLLDRHQDPIGHNFCLLENPGGDWEPWFSAAYLIAELLGPLLRDAEKGPEAVRAGEADMPEPASALFRYDPATIVLVPEQFLVQELPAKSGTMTLLRGTGRICLLVDATGIGEIEPALSQRFTEPGAIRWQGRWVAVDAPPRPEAGSEGILAALEVAEGQLLERRLRKKFPQGKRRHEAMIRFGITFLEEGPSRNEQRRTWLFAEIKQMRGEKPRVARLLRAHALGRAERARRLPELPALTSAHVVLIGVGSLGGSVALELAKAGVAKLDLFDDDLYDVNNSVRHVLPATLAGTPKALAVAETCRALNPFIEVCGHDLAIGDSLPAAERLDRALETATVVIDTTGALAVARHLATKARGSAATLIVAGLTAGSFGGDVFVVAPGAACLQCFLRAQQRQTIPKPPEGERSAVTPIGCRHPAFAGAGFEATELAAIVSRRTIQALETTSYPAAQNNWIVLDFRAAPHFREGQLAPDPDCELHP